MFLYICKVDSFFIWDKLFKHMKKYFLSLLAVCLSNILFAQFEYSAVGRNDAQTLGTQWGIVGGGFSAMLPNRDDLNADQRLDPQMMNFSWSAGAEYVYWFQHNIGFGAQFNYWNAGAYYTGKDTFTNLSLDAHTNLTYAKVPFLFHFKSYNRYYPNRRFRFNAYFGPYVALLLNYSESAKWYNDSLKFSSYSTFTKRNQETYTTSNGVNSSKQKSKINKDLYNPFDAGFVFALGGEVRLWRRTVIALHVRTDIGFSNVENTKGMKIKFANAAGEYPDGTPESDFSFWNGSYAKFNNPNAVDIAKGFVPNRPATKNFSVGTFLSIRRYF